MTAAVVVVLWIACGFTVVDALVRTRQGAATALGLVFAVAYAYAAVVLWRLP